MAEAVVKKLPMVLTDIRPGHELINLNYLVEKGIAKYARIPREVVYMVEQILEGRLKFDHQRSFETIVKPKNSVSVAEAIGGVIPEKSVLTVKNYQANI